MSERGYDVARLGEGERVAWSGGKSVQLVRQRFGIESFGVNAWSAGEVGGEVIDEHDELGAGAGSQEELYLVVSGRARFTVAGEDFEAGPGTLVFVRDPADRRGAVALEPDTTILVVGGVPGQAYRASPWEVSARAMPAFASGDFERAAQILGDILEAYPGNTMILYNLACAEARMGRRAEALAHLAEAAENPDLRELAQTDDDLESIRDDPAFPRVP